MEYVPQTIPDCGGINREAGRYAPVHVKEDRSLLHFRADVLQKVFTDHFK